MNKKELNEKYARILNWHDEYLKELWEYINEAFAMHDNVFEYKCPTHDSWKEADKAGTFDAMEDLPTYLMVDNGLDGLDEVYITRAERTDFSIYIDGYDHSISEFVTDYYTNSHIDDLQSIASFINAVLEQDTEGQEEEEDAPTLLCMEDYEKGEALMRKDGFFSITSVHRDDLSENGFDVSAVTDAQMEELADRMRDDYVEQMFFQSLRNIAEIMGIPKLTL